MLTLSSSLLAHQKLAARVPRVRLRCYSTRANLPIFRWSRYYTGAEADSPAAVVLSTDGSLLRARNDAGTLYHSKVAAPGSGSNYSSWTSLGAISTAGTGVALATSPTGTESILISVSGNLVRWQTSTDNGATWSAVATAVNHGAAVTWVAVTYRPANNDVCVFYSAGATVYRLRRTAGAWAGAGTAWTNTLAGVNGIACSEDGSDFHLCVTGADAAGNQRAYGCAMGDGGLPANAWSSLNVIADADPTSTTSFAGGAVLMPSLEAHVFFAQRENGLVLFRRAFYSHSLLAFGANSSTWLEPEPHEAPSLYGVAGYASPTAAWLVTPSGVWYAAHGSTTDYSAILLSATAKLTPTSGVATIVLDDTTNALLLNSQPNLFVGCTASMTLGYITTAGIEYGATWNFTVQRIKHTIERGTRLATLQCDGPWEAIGRWHAPAAWETAAAVLTRSAVAARIVGRAGYQVTTTGPSSDWTSGQPGFAYGPGETGESALNRLLSIVQDHVRTEEALFRIRDCPPAEASVYTFGGPGNHPLPECSTQDAEQPINWARAQSASRYAETMDLPSVYSTGNRLRVQRNLDLGTDAKAIAAALAILRRSVIATPIATATVPCNVGLQLFDVVTINYSLLNLSSTLYRVIGLGLDYRRGDRPGSARYDQTLELAER
jgi:hypothetical protein